MQRLTSASAGLNSWPSQTHLRNKLEKRLGPVQPILNLLLVAVLLKKVSLIRLRNKNFFAIAGRTRQRGGVRVGRQGGRRKGRDGKRSRAGARRSKKKAGGRRSGRRVGRQEVNQLYGAPSDEYGAPGNQVDINLSCPLSILFVPFSFQIGFEDQAGYGSGAASDDAGSQYEGSGTKSGFPNWADRCGEGCQGEPVQEVGELGMRCHKIKASNKSFMGLLPCDNVTCNNCEKIILPTHLIGKRQKSPHF